MDYIYNYYLGGPYVGALIKAMKGVNFWLTALICVIILALPVLTTRFYAADINPSLVDKIRLKRKMQMKSKTSENPTRTPSARRARRSLRSGYAFAHHVSYWKTYPIYIIKTIFKCQLKRKYSNFLCNYSNYFIM